MAQDSDSRIRPGFLALVFIFVGAAAVFLIPAMFQGRTRVEEVQCMGHLRSLGQLLMGYADENDGRFPLAAGERPPAYQSFQLLVDSVPDARDPKIYFCPASDEELATPDPTGHFRLSQKNVSYAYISQVVEMSHGAKTKRPLACDHSLDHHKTGITVLYRDSSVGWLSRGELEEKYGGFEAFLEANGLTK
jgi:hypothetical protein